MTGRSERLRGGWLMRLLHHFGWHGRNWLPFWLDGNILVECTVCGARWFPPFEDFSSVPNCVIAPQSRFRNMPEKRLAKQRQIMAETPTQTTGGDAGERARAIAIRIVETDFGDDPSDPITLISAWIESALRDSRREGAEEARELRHRLQEAQGTLDHNIQYREGAEAMREADARACSERGAWAESKIADDKDNVWANYSNACDDCAEIVRALPIPGNTDAG